MIPGFAQHLMREKKNERLPYREGYPMFDVGAARRAWAAGLDHVVWRQRRGEVAGLGRVEWSNQATLSIDYWIDRTDFVPWGKIKLTVEMKASRGYNARALVRCPFCDATVGVLIHVHTWQCAQCSKLPNRSVMLSVEVRRFERWEQLNAQAERGRPHKMRQFTFDEIVRERDELQPLIDANPVSASSRYFRRVSAEWVTALPAVLVQS